VAAQPGGQQQARRAEADDPEQRDAGRRDVERAGEPAAADDARGRRQPERERGRAGDGEPGERALRAGAQRRAWRWRAWVRTRLRKTGLPTR
jgi:hypothetical protein